MRVPFHPSAWQSGAGGLGGVFRGRFAGLDKSVGLHLDVISGNFYNFKVGQLRESHATKVIVIAQAEGS